MKNTGVIISVVGLPHSGKSVFLGVLYKALQKRTGSFFIQRACPDGEGQWTIESSDSVVQKIRVKGKFDPDFIKFNLDSLKGLRESFKVVLLDLGGLPSEENRELLNHSDYYIFLRKDSDDKRLQEWQRLLNEVKAEKLAEINSVLGGESSININDREITGTLSDLCREGVPEKTVACIEQVAEFLIKRFGGEGKMEFEIKTRDYKGYLYVEVVIGGNGIITPKELPSLLKKVEMVVGNKYFGKGVVISGRLPVWAYVSLAHLFHASRWVGTFDPRMKGAVVVSAHSNDRKVGDVVNVEL